MAASGFGGFKFGSANPTTSTTGFSLGGAKTTASAFSFGTPQATTTASTGFSFGSAASQPAKTGVATAFSFGGAAKATAASTGFSFGGATTTTAASTGFSFGGAATTTTASTGFGGSLFGKTTTAATTGFSLTGATTGSAPAFKLGGTSTATVGGFGLSKPATTNATENKPPENVKEQTVPTELNSLVDNIEKHIKKQKEVKDEISKISSEQISTTRDELKSLQQNAALIGNALQRNSIAVENLKLSVNQELKNGEICHRLNQVAGSTHHDFTAPIEYFQRLVYSFESRISNYRQELEELEAFLTSASPINDFSPQDLSSIMKRLNESFIGLASELYQVHEQIKIMKEKYLHYRRVVFSDASDPFAPRKKKMILAAMKVTKGPSPFPVAQGASIMAAAFKTEQKSTATIGGTTLTKPSCFPAGSTSSFSLSKPTGLTRSFSFDGSSNNKTNLGGSLSASGSLFNKPTLGVTPSLNSGSFTLQNPPCGKRGRIL
eukprot:TCONS_00000699-protein